MQLTKGQNSRDPFYKAVEEVAQDLDLRIKNIINSQQGDVAFSTTDISPARVMRFLFYPSIQNIIFSSGCRNDLLLLLKSEDCFLCYKMMLKM